MYTFICRACKPRTVCSPSSVKYRAIEMTAIIIVIIILVVVVFVADRGLFGGGDACLLLKQSRSLRLWSLPKS